MIRITAIVALLVTAIAVSPCLAAGEGAVDIERLKQEMAKRGAMAAEHAAMAAEAHAEHAKKQDAQAQMAHRLATANAKLNMRIAELKRAGAELKKAAKHDEEARAKLKEIQAQMKAAQARQKDLDRAARARDKRIRVWGKPNVKFAPARRGKLAKPTIIEVELNARDAAHFEVARILIEEEKHDEAAAELGMVVNDSPEKPAVSAAHFSIANICRRHLGDADNAIKHYAKVEGDLHDDAIRELIDTFEELDEIDKAAEFLNGLIEKTDDKEMKVRLLDDLAGLLRRNGDDDGAIAALRRIPEIITYDEAAKMRRKPAARPQPQPEMPVMQTWQWGGMHGGNNVRKIIRRKAANGEEITIETNVFEVIRPNLQLKIHGTIETRVQHHNNPAPPKKPPHAEK